MAVALGAAGYWLFRGDAKQEHKPLLDLASNSAPRVDETDLPAKTNSGSMPPSPLRMRGTPEPSRVAVPPVASAVSLVDAFEQEPFDAVIAARQTEQVRAVVEELAETGVGSARIEKLACRARLCRLQLASHNKKALVQFVDALQDERGFLGKAESIMMSREEEDIILYLRFPPPK